PAVTLEQRDDVFDDLCVGLIEKSVECFAAPPNSNVEIGAEGSADPLEAPEITVGHDSSLDIRHERTRDVGLGSDVFLSPGLADPNRAERTAGPEEVHPGG